MDEFKTLNGYSVKDEFARDEIKQMKINFQDGVDTIYNAIVAQGVTPSSSTPSDCAIAITSIGSTQYNSGRSQGRKDVGNNVTVSTIGASSTSITISNLTIGNYYVIVIYAMSNQSEIINLNLSNVTTLLKGIERKNTASGTSRPYQHLGFAVIKATSTSTTITFTLSGSSASIIAFSDVIKLGPYE